jgi:hypothetical protein
VTDEFLLPRLTANDYKVLKTLPVRDLPATYDQWKKMIADRRLECLRVGSAVVEVDVHAEEYIRFCGERGHGYNLKTLEDFVTEKRAAER